MSEVSCYPITRLGYPVVPLRLYLGLIFVLPFFTFLAVMAHIRFGWFINHRWLYLLSGIIAGILGGYIEAYLVTERLKKEVEVVAWFLIPVSLIFWLLPTAYIYLSFGYGEFLPFATYFLFPSLTSWMVTSGFIFRRFENEEKVRVFTFFLGRYVPYPKYWIETPETLEIELYGFLEAVAEKDVSWLLYYGKYAEQMKNLLEKISEKGGNAGKRFSSFKEPVMELLEVIRRFNQKRNKITRIFIGSLFLWITLMMLAAANNFFDIPQKYGGHIYLITIVTSFLLIFAYPLLKNRTLNSKYHKAAREIFSKIDSETETTIKDVLKQMEHEDLT
jgi:hypothetical protein